MRASKDVDKIKSLEKKVRKLQKELRDYKQTFALQQTRMGLAVEAWRKATGKIHIIPDLGQLLEWLLEHYQPQLSPRKEADQVAREREVPQEDAPAG